MKTIDARGILCPKPVIMTKNALEEMNENEQLLTIVDNEVAKVNMTKLYTNLGYNFEIEEKEGLFYITGIKGNGEIKIKLSNKDKVENNSNLVVLIDKDFVGHGNDELGHTLIKTFIYTLTELEERPKDIIFVNGGVKLTTEGSEVIEDLKKLEEMGLNIYSCGMCLNYYKLDDKLKVGEVSNMYEIADKLMKSSNTIKI